MQPDRGGVCKHTTRYPGSAAGGCANPPLDIPAQLQGGVQTPHSTGMYKKKARLNWRACVVAIAGNWLGWLLLAYSINRITLSDCVNRPDCGHIA